MENENELDLDSQNQVKDIVLDEQDDADAIKEKFNELSETHKKVTDYNRQLFARAKKAEGFELKDGKWVKPEKPPVEPKPEPKPDAKTGELDETQLDYFDLKGYSDSDEVAVFQKIMQKTGMSAREALKDEYALAKIKSIRDEKAVKNATPSGTKRAGGQTDDLNAAIAKFEQTGQLPDDFALKSEVINATVEKQDTNKPSWHK